MAKRRMAIITVLVCFCLWISSFYVMAVSTTDAKEPIDINQDCTLTIIYASNTTAFENVSVNLYKIADVSTDFQYTLTTDFNESQVILNGIKANSEWDAIRTTIESYIVANGVENGFTIKTNAQGLACFKDLKPGLYLAVVGTVTQNEQSYNFDSCLINLPGLNADGIWQYQVNVTPKSQIITPSEKEYKVLKLWKGDEGKNVRPKSIEVEIFRDGTSYATVVLSKENNWSYSWVTKEDGAKWNVAEKNTPTGYKSSVEKRDNSFVVINTHSKPNKKPPFTGDTSNIMLYATIIMLSGSLLLILGAMGKRKLNEENK